MEEKMISEEKVKSLASKKSRKMPSLRFPEYEEEWEKKTLFELSENGFSNGAFNDPKKVGKGYRIINVKDMYINNTIQIDTLSRVAIDDKEFLKNRVEYGDIFFTRSSLVKEGIAYSNVNLSNAEDLTFDGHLIRMRPKKKLYSPLFLYYIFSTQNVRKQFIIRGKTATMTTIGQEDIAQVKISYPALSEQKKIAGFLNAVDIKIKQLTKKKELLEQYKKGVMQQIFSKEIRFKDENGNNYPDWEEKRLGEISDVRDGTHESPKYKNEGFPLITSKNLMLDGSIDFKNVNLISNEDYQSINKRSGVTRGDILFGMIGTIGNPVIVRNEGFAIKNVALIKEKNNLLNNFLLYYLKSRLISKQFYEQNSGGTQKFIALGNIRDLKILVPKIQEQQIIANFLKNVDNKINIIDDQLEQVKLFKKGLLQQMFI